MTVLRYIFIAFEVVLLFNLLIAVHELGHFLAAKRHFGAQSWMPRSVVYLSAAVWRGADWRGRHAQQAGGEMSVTASADTRRAPRQTPRTRCD